MACNQRDSELLWGGSNRQHLPWLAAISLGFRTLLHSRVQHQLRYNKVYIPPFSSRVMFCNKINYFSISLDGGTVNQCCFDVLWAGQMLKPFSTTGNTWCSSYYPAGISPFLFLSLLFPKVFPLNLISPSKAVWSLWVRFLVGISKSTPTPSGLSLPTPRARQAVSPSSPERESPTRATPSTAYTAHASINRMADSSASAAKDGTAAPAR